MIQVFFFISVTAWNKIQLDTVTDAKKTKKKQPGHKNLKIYVGMSYKNNNMLTP